jgi:hypothetical protein
MCYNILADADPGAFCLARYVAAKDEASLEKTVDAFNNVVEPDGKSVAASNGRALNGSAFATMAWKMELGET